MLNVDGLPSDPAIAAVYVTDMFRRGVVPERVMRRGCSVSRRASESAIWRDPHTRAGEPGTTWLRHKFTNIARSVRMHHARAMKAAKKTRSYWEQRGRYGRRWTVRA